jgi:hypothetical protein
VAAVNTTHFMGWQQPLVMLGILCTLFTPSALAQVDTDKLTAGDLIILCSANASDTSYASAKAFCYGYIDATLDYHQALTSGPKFKPLTCPPAGVSREEVALAVIAWSQQNSQVKDEQPVQMIMQAAASTWPCDN